MPDPALLLPAEETGLITLVKQKTLHISLGNVRGEELEIHAWIGNL